MKRRTFLRLSPAILALPFSLSLTGCNTKRKDVSIEEPASPPPDPGLTLDQARQYNDGNGGLFIHRNDKFYPLSEHIYAYQALVIMDNTDSSANTLSESDELVYISDTADPSMMMFYVSPVDQTGTTALLACQIQADTTIQADTPEEVITKITLETRQKDFNSIDNVTLNGIDVLDCLYDYNHDWIGAGIYERGGGIYQVTGFLDLSSEASITVGYYEGTSYQELTLDGTFPYYSFDSDHKIPIVSTLTKEGYAIVNTSRLEKGTSYAFGWFGLWPSNATILTITD